MPQLPTRVRLIGHPGYSETLPRESGSAKTSRRLVHAACSAWWRERLGDHAALVMTELVADAVQHARRESIRVAAEQPTQARTSPLRTSSGTSSG